MLFGKPVDQYNVLCAALSGCPQGSACCRSLVDGTPRRLIRWSALSLGENDNETGQHVARCVVGTTEAI